jgi:hypothetical protein
MITFQAIKSQRVREALGSIHQHILGAINLTQIEGVGTEIEHLRRAPLPPVPAVTAIKPDEIAYKNRQDVAREGLEIIGENLAGVREIHLIRRGGVQPWITLANRIEHLPDASGKRDGQSLKAHFDNLGSAPSGHYNLLLIDNDEKPTPFPDAVTIYPQTASDIEPQGQPTQYGIAELFPPFGKAGQQLSLWVIGNEASFTEETMFYFDHPGLVVTAKALKAPNMALLTVSISDDPQHRDKEYKLTAKTGQWTHSKSFSVHPHHEGWTTALEKLFGFHVEGD